MNFPSVIFGVALIGFGVMTAVLRKIRPTIFRKLESMKAALGPRKGVAIHIVFYTVLPILAGVMSTILGVLGMSFFN
jgi:ABC-type phosphate transport system permease subunit